MEITWTDHTWNPWWGCSRVSAGCAHCYAESLARRYGRATWGAGQARSRASAATLRAPLAWARRARRTGKRERVFALSMGDWADADVPAAWRDDMWSMIRETRDALQWLLLSKRPENWPTMLPPDWGFGWPGVALGVSIEDQASADTRIPPLLVTPADHHFLSIEPILGPVNLARPLRLRWSHVAERIADPRNPGGATVCGGWVRHPRDTAPLLFGFIDRPDWIIVGGESGPRARPLDHDWVRTLRDQAAAAGVPFFFKQYGGTRPDREAPVLDGRVHHDSPAWPAVDVPAP